MVSILMRYYSCFIGILAYLCVEQARDHTRLSSSFSNWSWENNGEQIEKTGGRVWVDQQ